MNSQRREEKTSRSRSEGECRRGGRSRPGRDIRSRSPGGHRPYYILTRHSARWRGGEGFFPTVCLRCCRRFCGVFGLTLMAEVRSGGVLRVLFARFSKTPGWGTTRELVRTSEALISSWEKDLAKKRDGGVAMFELCISYISVQNEKSAVVNTQSIDQPMTLR